MPVRRTTIEKDVHIVDLEEVGERKVSFRVSAACEGSERDHERRSERRDEGEEGGCQVTKEDIFSSLPTPSSLPPQQDTSNHGYSN
jgi:hypothetical protein